MLVYVLGISGDGTSYLRGIGYYGVPDVGGTDLGQSGSHSVGLGTEVCRTGDVEERGAALVGYLAEFRTHLAFDGIHPPNEFLRTFVGIGEESDHECTVGVSSVLPTGKTEYGLTGIGRGSGIHVGQVVLLAPGVYGIRIRFRDAFEVRGFPVTYGRERGERLVHVLAVNIGRILVGIIVGCHDSVGDPDAHAYVQHPLGIDHNKLIHRIHGIADVVVDRDVLHGHGLLLAVGLAGIRLLEIDHFLHKIQIGLVHLPVVVGVGHLVVGVAGDHLFDLRDVVVVEVIVLIRISEHLQPAVGVAGVVPFVIIIVVEKDYCRSTCHDHDRSR